MALGINLLVLRFIGPPSTWMDLITSLSMSTRVFWPAFDTADFKILANSPAARFLVKAKIFKASATGFFRINSTTWRAFRGVTLVNREIGCASILKTSFPVFDYFNATAFSVLSAPWALNVRVGENSPNLRP